MNRLITMFAAALVKAVFDYLRDHPEFLNQVIDRATAKMPDLADLDDKILAKIPDLSRLDDKIIGLFPDLSRLPEQLINAINPFKR
ncbi:hypothetical protein SEA_ATKINBUA_8 [Mycobacterium phage Atkinbua]|nr:hypothetical protein SEA_ATKINBUA_8 [Mycobacterium phage Atkinbua]